MEQLTFSDFLTTGLVCGFFVFFAAGVFMILTEVLYGITYLTLGLDVKNAPKVLQSNPLRKYFFCCWPEEYTSSIEDGLEVFPYYLGQGFVMVFVGPAIGILIGGLIGAFYFSTLLTLAIASTLGALLLIRFVSTSTWGHEARVTTLEDKNEG
jgi:hypothetical protein